MRYLLSGVSSSNFKFARFLHCACSVSTPGRSVTIEHTPLRPAWSIVTEIGASRNPFSVEKVSRLPGVDTEHAQ